MIQAAKSRFRAVETASLDLCDLRRDYPIAAGRIVCVTLAVLTLQFIPIEYRQSILDEAYRTTSVGGCLLMVEKILGSDGLMSELLKRLYLRLKADNGYTVEEIERKRLSLEGVLVPQSAAENERMLRAAGFRHVERFWSFLNFSGWIAIRG